MTAVAIRGARLVDPLAVGEPKDAAVVLFAGGRVAAVVEADAPLPAAFDAVGEWVDGRGAWLLPGWIDLQVNDIEWLARGAATPAEHATRALEVARYQAARGVTGLVLATLAAPEAEIIAYLQGLRRVLDAGEAVVDAPEAACLGVLVEGTFMNPVFCGAHNPAHVVTPELPLLDRLVDTGAVRLINVAPEMGDAALDVIARATQRGVVVGVGHARPHAERVREAVAAGLRYVIHLGNGPTGSSLKGFAGGGLLEEALANDALTATVIADGVHIDRRLLRDWLERKGEERFIAVSDAGFACGPPAGEFEVFGIRGRVASGGDWLEVVRPDAPPPNPRSSEFAPLFGSAADMRRVFSVLVDVLTTATAGICQRAHDALSVPEALRIASRATSLNPARLLGVGDRGRLVVGARADALLVRVEGEPGALRIDVERVWLGGRDVAVAGGP